MLESSDNIRPLRDRVFVKELPWPAKAGSIHLPDQAQKHDELWRAVVVAVGPGKPPIGLLRRALRLLAVAQQAASEWSLDVFAKGDGEHGGSWDEQAAELMADTQEGIAVSFGADVKPGDVVLVSKYMHTKVRVGGEICSIIAASDILGVVSRGVEQVRDALLRALTREDAGLADEVRNLLERRERTAQRVAAGAVEGSGRGAVQ